MFRSNSLVALTTDFGEGSSYSAALKGAVLSVNAAARILDLSHRLPPQDRLAAALFLDDVIPYFPAGTIHVVVVDPGVGTNRALLCVLWRDQALLVPDNGCWTTLEAREPVQAVYRLTESRYWSNSISATFHGRDILGPAAGHLSLGAPPDALGPIADTWMRMAVPEPRVEPDRVLGQILHVDSFGNAITNLTAAVIAGSPRCKVGAHRVDRFVRTYGDAEPGTVVALIGSSGRLEIAVVNGSAADRLSLRVGDPVQVTRS
jgi:S-adenosylmethionine hydrolase